MDTATPIWPFVAMGSNVFDGLEIERAEGAWLYTADGRRILDASAGAVVGNIGWGRREVAEAAAGSLGRLTYALPPFATRERVSLARRLRDAWLPRQFERVSFFGSGSEANEAAMRLARQYQIGKGRPERWKIIGRHASYSGTSLATLAVGGHAGRRRDFEPMLVDLPRIPPSYCLRCPFDSRYPDCGLACAKSLQQTIELEGPGTIAGFLAEPIVGTSGGALIPPDDYWSEIAGICQQYDIPLIADEVLTGFGRTGARFAMDHWQIAADILVMGKGMSGGYAAISGVAATGAVLEAIENAKLSPMFHTYCGHPVQCATADKVLEIMEREDLLTRVQQLAPSLESAMRRLEENPWVIDVRGRGFLWAVEIAANRATKEPFPEAAGITFKVLENTVKRGVFTYFGGTGEVRDVVIVAPPFIVGEAEFTQIADALDEAIREVCGAQRGA